jgi:pyruvate dehydrogenase E1 component alpha subunit
MVEKGYLRDIDMADGAPRVDGGTLERLYAKLWLTRRFEEVVAEIYPSDKIKSPVHLSIGQESIAVGVCDALRADDFVSGTYRGHATYLAKGGDAKAMMAELFGKDGGCARGKGGSMHLVDMGMGILGSSAVVGSTVPVAMGYAFALKREGKGRVVAAFFGDGATEEGVLWESLNFAGLHKLPMLFVCENNGYAIHEPIEKRWASRDLVGKVKAFGVPATRIEDGDVLAIRAATVAALEPMRTGDSGARFLECMTYRWREHVGPNPDYEAGYRSRAELEPWQATDQVARLASMIAPGPRRRIEDEVDRTVRDAVSFAESSPFPKPSELSTHVFS